MIVCASDFCVHAGREALPYPNAALLEIALKACAEINARAIARASSKCIREIVMEPVRRAAEL